MSRYKVPRTNHSWKKYYIYELKALGAVINEQENLITDEVDKRLRELWPRVSQWLFKHPKSIEEINIELLGGTYSPDKLWQRIDRYHRYGEAMETKPQVELAYFAVTQGRRISTKETRIEIVERDNGTFSDATVRYWVAEQDGKCAACDRPFTEYRRPVGGHVRPRCRGGTTHKDNCRALCVECNQECGTLDLIAFIGKLRAKEIRGRRIA